MTISKYLKIILGIITISILYSCYDEQNFVQINNQTGKDIYCAFSTLHPDTSITSLSEARIKREPEYFVPAGATENASPIELCDEQTWNDYVPHDTLFLFVFDKTVVDNTSWYTIITKYMIYKRMEIAYPDVANNKCVITVK